MQRPRIITVTLNPAIDMRMGVAQPRLGALNRAQQVLLEPSGKGINVARALQRQGVPVRAIAPIGGPFGQMLEAGLHQPDPEPSLEWWPIRIAGFTRCNVKILDQVGVSTEFNAPGPGLQSSELEALKTMLGEQIQTGDFVVFAGSLPSNASDELYGELIGFAQAHGAWGVLDAEGPALRAGLGAKPHLVKPNRVEAESLLGRAIKNQYDALEAAQQIQALGAHSVVLSLGADGAVFLHQGGHEVVRAPTLRPRTTVGCGDALLAGTLAGLLGQKPWEQIALHATATAAARAVGTGIEFPDLGAIATMLEQMRADPRLEGHGVRVDQSQ